MSGVGSTADIWREEIFGPVLAIATFDDEADAVRLANDTEFGLVGYVYTQDLARGRHRERQCQQREQHRPARHQRGGEAPRLPGEQRAQNEREEKGFGLGRFADAKALGREREQRPGDQPGFIEAARATGRWIGMGILATAIAFAVAGVVSVVAGLLGWRP